MAHRFICGTHIDYLIFLMKICSHSGFGHGIALCVRHWLSSDTKEERLRWTDCLNEALVSLRAWHADALRPVRRHQQAPAASAVH